MTCEDLLRVLDEYVDGELPRARRNEAAAHLAGCASCREEESRLRDLIGAAAALPEELPLSGDPWGRIDARLGEAARVGPADSSPLHGDRRGRIRALFGRSGENPLSRERRDGIDAPLRRFRARESALPHGGHPALAAAMVVILVGGAVAAAVLFRRPAPPALDPGAGAVAPIARDLAPAPVPLDEAGRALLEAKHSLEAAFREQSSSLSPGTVRQVEENIRIIEAAIAEIQQALANDPGNPQLRKLLITARQREIAVLTQVTRTAASRQVRW